MLGLTPREWRAHGLLALAALIYSGYNVVLAKTLRTKVSATGFSLCREVLAVPLLYCWAAWQERPSWPGEFVRFLLLGLLLGSFQLCFAVGVGLTDASTAAIFQCVEPSTAAVLGAAIGGEACSRKKVASALLAGAGVAVLQVQLAPASSMHDRPLARALGSGLLFCQGIGIALYCLLQKSLVRANVSGRSYGPITVTAHAYSVSLAVMAAAAGVSSAARLETPAPYSAAGFRAILEPNNFLVLAYAALFSSVLGYSMRAEANKILNASTLVLYNALQPPLTALVDKILDPRTAEYGLSQLCASLLVAAALALAASDERTAGHKRRDDDVILLNAVAPPAVERRLLDDPPPGAPVSAPEEPVRA